MDCDVIVIGAGLSGLSAAKWLTEAGVSAIVLEAMDRVGGRTCTKRDPKVNYVDIGGAYVGPTQNRLLRMSKEFGIENYKVNEVEDILHYRDGKRMRFQADKFPGPRNIFVSMDINHVVRLMDSYGEQIPSDAPWNAPKADEWDTMTFKEFLEKNCSTKAGLDFFKAVISLCITSDAYESSLLGFLWYVKQCGGTKRILSTTNGGQERKFKGGTQQISEKIADKVGRDRVLTGNPVIAINQESKEEVIVKALNGKEYKAKYVILAIPPMLQMKIHFKPPLPPLRNQLNQRAPMGTVIKSILYYSSTFWRTKGCCGSFFIEGDDTHPMFYTLDDTKPDGSHPAIIGFILSDKCRRLVSLSPDERKSLLSKSLAHVSGMSEFLKPIHYEEKIWMEEQYTGGCYTSMYPPGFFTRYGKIIREPIGRLYFAGTETATQWSGYMEGAIQAGERAAREILYNMGKLTRDMIWQQEPQSEDVVPRPFDSTMFEKYMPSVPGFLKIISLTAALGIAASAYVKCPFIRKH